MRYSPNGDTLYKFLNKITFINITQNKKIAVGGHDNAVYIYSVPSYNIFRPNFD